MTLEQQWRLKNGSCLLCATAQTVPPPLICTVRHSTHCAWYVKRKRAQAYSSAAKLTSRFVSLQEVYSKIESP